MTGQYMRTPSRMSYVYNGKECVGFVIERGLKGAAAYDREECLLGAFSTAGAAARAVLEAALSEERAG